MPLTDFPDIERIEPAARPTQDRPKIPPASGPERLFQVESATPKPIAHRSDPYRQKPKTRLGGSKPYPEGQATIDRLPVEPLTDNDRLIGREQSGTFLEKLKDRLRNKGKAA